MERVDSGMRALVTPVEDLALAALLLALGFEAVSLRRVEEHDLGSRGHAGPGRCVWEFASVGAGGRRFEEVAAAWRGALRDDPGVPAEVRAARLAVHNLHCLTSAAVNGEPLYAYGAPDCTRLSNDCLSGAMAVPRVQVPAAPAVTLRTTGPAACALAVGCRLTGFIQGADGFLWCVAPGGCCEFAPGDVEARWRDLRWVTERGNVAPLAVAIATLINRRELLGGVHRGRTLHLVRSGDRTLILPDGAPREMVAQGSRLMHM